MKGTMLDTLLELNSFLDITMAMQTDLVMDLMG
jgi:hypothetical protein